MQECLYLGTPPLTPLAAAAPGGSHCLSFKFNVRDIRETFFTDVPTQEKEGLQLCVSLSSQVFLLK